MKAILHRYSKEDISVNVKDIEIIKESSSVMAEGILISLKDGTEYDFIDSITFQLKIKKKK